MSVQSWSGTEPHWSASPVVSSSVPTWAGAALLLCLAQAGHAGAEQSHATCGPDPHGPTPVPNCVRLCWSPVWALTRAGLGLCHTGAEPTSVPSCARRARAQPRPRPCGAEPDDARAEHTLASGCATQVLGRARVESAHYRAGLCRAVPGRVHAGASACAGAGAGAGRAIPTPVPPPGPPMPFSCRCHRPSTRGTPSAHVVLRRGARAGGRAGPRLCARRCPMVARPRPLHRRADQWPARAGPGPGGRGGTAVTWGRRAVLKRAGRLWPR